MAAPAPVAPRGPSLLDRIGNSIRATPESKIMNIMRVVNILNAGLLGFSSVWAFMNASSNVSGVYLALYIGIFGLILLFFEMRVSATEDRFRRLFGFMYSFWGRTLFLLFLGTINFGIDEPVCITIGVITVLNGCISCGVLCQHPGFRGDLYGGHVDGTVNDPAKLSEAQLMAYLSAHPTLAQNAVAANTFATSAPQQNATSPASFASQSSPPAPAPRAPARAPAPAPSDASVNPFDN